MPRGRVGNGAETGVCQRGERVLFGNVLSILTHAPELVLKPRVSDSSYQFNSYSLHRLGSLFYFTLLHPQ